MDPGAFGFHVGISCLLMHRRTSDIHIRNNWLICNPLSLSSLTLLPRCYCTFPPGDTECDGAVQSNGLSPFSRLSHASSRGINIHPPPTSENSFATRACHRPSLIMTGCCTSRGIALRATGLQICDNAIGNAVRRSETRTRFFIAKIRLCLASATHALTPSRSCFSWS